MKLTEKLVADNLFRWLISKSSRICVPNCHALGSESDLLTVTRARLLTDHEIKLTRADFRCEFSRRNPTKLHKHERMRRVYDGNATPYEIQRTPNYFFFVTPAGLIKNGEHFPGYAGLIEFAVTQSGTFFDFRVRKRSRLLHSEKASDETIRRMAVSLTHRYFDLRKK